MKIVTDSVICSRIWTLLRYVPGKAISQDATLPLKTFSQTLETKKTKASEMEILYYDQ